MPSDDAVRRVVELIRSQPSSPQDGPHVLGKLQRLCRAAAAALPAGGVGISVISNVGQQLTAASSPRHAEVEELQFTLGEGPCLAALAAGAPVLVSDLSDSNGMRWPGYSAGAQEHQVRAVFAFPLQVGAARLGALDVYEDRPGRLADLAVSLALAFAEVAMTTLLDASHASLDPGSPSLDELFGESQSGLYHAQGMVMIQLGVTLPEAMSRLRAHAYANERRLSEVAADVVARRITFTSDEA